MSQFTQHISLDLMHDFLIIITSHDSMLHCLSVMKLKLHISRKIQVIFLNHAQENGEATIMGCKPDSTAAYKFGDELPSSWKNDTPV